MRYYGIFADIRQQQYRVEVITDNNTSESREVVLGGSPFTTEMNSNDMIYDSTRFSSATVRIVQDNATDFMFDVYSGTAMGVKVTLYNNETDDILWTGYATPVSYDTDYKSIHDELEINAIDGLAVLQYVKYTPVNPMQRGIRTFAEIICKILQDSGVYNNFYFSTATHLEDDNTCLITKACISESNFFDEKEDVNESDEDVAWTEDTVLEEIAKFFGVIVTAVGSDVYFIDYDAVRHGINTYYKFDVSDPTTYETVTLSNPIEMSSSMYARAGAEMSLSEVYNKVTVKDSLYTFDEILPDMYATATNITASSDPSVSSIENVAQGGYGEIVQSVIGNGADSSNDNMEVLIDRIRNPQTSSWKDYNAVFVKYFTSAYYRFNTWEWTGSRLVPSTYGTMNYTQSRGVHGALLTRFDVTKLDKNASAMMELINRITSGSTYTLDDFLAEVEKSSVDFTDCILMLNPNTGHISNNNITDYPFVETIEQDTAALFGGENAYLVISGTYYFHYFVDDPYPIPNDEADIAEGRYAMDAGQTNIVAKLQIGEQYWNGSEWSETESTFNIPYISETASADERRADQTMFEDNTIVNTVSWRFGLEEQGYCIPVPSGSLINGMPLLTIYKPFDPNYHSTKSGDNEGQHYKHNVVVLKDFKMQACIGDPTYSGVNDTDTEYSNVIDADNVNEADSIEFKINTWDNKAPNFSSVALVDNGSYSWLDKTVNDALYDGESDWQDWDDDAAGENGVMRQEEHLIYRLVHQYSTPAVKLTMHARTYIEPYSLLYESILDKHFIVDSQSMDYKMCASELNLREFKS